MSGNTDAPLTNAQVHALLDILSHDEVYSEISDFRWPGKLSSYGPPFKPSPSGVSTSPSLQALVRNFLTTLPGMRDVSTDFWQVHAMRVIDDLAADELSESYDKGALGIRRTLSTAVSALVEYLVRGVYAGFDEPPPDAPLKVYDLDSADSLQAAFRDFMQQAVYGDMLDAVFERTAQTNRLTDHDPITQAFHEYVLVNLASFLHYTLIISPKGQGLLVLINNANKLVPYTIIRQTLKIGNVASMISALVRVVLAKMSVASVTNWMGITQGSDEGMNLMQQIISQVLQWDIRDFKSRSSKIEKNKEGLSREQMQALQAYVRLSREEHEVYRDMSKQMSRSIVRVALEETSTASYEMSLEAHTLALEYLSIQLSIRDREQIIKTLCHSSPDHLTEAVREAVTAYEPLIRQLHNAVDLSDTLYDFEVFLRDLIKLARIPENNTDRKPAASQAAAVPSVGDFVQLLRKHQFSSHKFLHQCAKNGPQIVAWFKDYAHNAAEKFRRETSTPSEAHTGSPDAGDLTEPLQDMFGALPTEQQESLKPILNTQHAYLAKLHAASRARLRAVLGSPPSTSSTPREHNLPARMAIFGTSRGGSKPSSRDSSPDRLGHKHVQSSLREKIGPGIVKSHTFGTPSTKPLSTTATESSVTVDGVAPGPGAYLARWQELLDNTKITPAEPEGPVRSGAAKSVAEASADVDSASPKESVNAPAGPTPGKKAADPGDSEADLFQDAREQLDSLDLADNGLVAGVKKSATMSDVAGSPTAQQRQLQDVQRPDVTLVIDALGSRFRQLLAVRGKKWQH